MLLSRVFGGGIMLTCDICEEPATTEWEMVDEEGERYSTLRCDEHPEEDLDYHPTDAWE